MVLLKSKPGLMINESLIPQSFNSFLNEMLHDSKSINESMTERFHFSPKADIIEKQNSFEIHLSLPGVKKEDVKINIEGDVLTISGEKQSTELSETDKMHRRDMHYGKFSRSFNLGKVNKAKIEAKYENGILNLSLPKTEAELPLTVEIK